MTKEQKLENLLFICLEFCGTPVMAVCIGIMVTLILKNIGAVI